MINIEELVLQIITSYKQNWTLTADEIKDFKRFFSEKNKLTELPSNIQLLKAYRSLQKKWLIEKDTHIEWLLKKRAVRSSSWIVAIQVLTKPFPCPWKCIFCPNDSTMPKSYIKSEPGAMRALLNEFDPIKQVYNRLLSLSLAGHQTDKIEMIILGWTWDVYPDDYKKEFIKWVYDACNTFHMVQVEDTQSTASTDQNRFYYKLHNLEEIVYAKTLEEALELNETAQHRIIWLTIETRPDQVTDSHCKERREIGVTRIEMGIQSMDDEVLAANKRGNTVDDIRKACHTLRQYGFKISAHIMPGLYLSNEEKDIQTFRDIYTDTYIKPDEIKFYPTSVIQNTELYTLYKEGKYIPLTIEKIKEIIRYTFLHIIPPYTRIKRLIRDIPAPEIEAWSNITNLAQLMQYEIKKEIKGNEQERNAFYKRIYGEYTLYSSPEDAIQQLVKTIPTEEEITTYIIWTDPDIHTMREFVCLDTRSREIRQKTKQTHETVNMVIRMYKSSVGTEIFCSFEDTLGYLLWFTRLLLPHKEQSIPIPWLGEKTAIIRELHIYGNLESLKKPTEKITKQDDGIVQHTWLGKQLMWLAETIARSYGYERLSVISWIGVRAYYKKIGYEKEGTYMVKYL